MSDNLIGTHGESTLKLRTKTWSATLIFIVSLLGCAGNDQTTATQKGDLANFPVPAIFQSIDSSKLSGNVILNSGESRCKFVISGNNVSCDLKLSQKLDNLLDITWYYDYGNVDIVKLIIASSSITVPASTKDISLASLPYVTGIYDLDSDTFSNLQELNWGSDPLSGSSRPSATVPNIVGLTETQANTLILDSDFTVGLKTTAYHDSIPENHIISQSPAAAVVRPLKTPIDFVVSLGPSLGNFLQATPADKSFIRDDQAIKLQFDRTIAPASLTTVGGDLVTPGYMVTYWNTTQPSDTFLIEPNTRWALGDNQSLTISVTDNNGLVTDVILTYDVRAELLSFVTSATGTGDFSSWADAGGQSGLLAADQVCNALASGKGFPGTYIAWISDSSNDAYCRIHGHSGLITNNCGQSGLPSGAGPWMKVDGDPFIGKLLGPQEYASYYPQTSDENGALIDVLRTYYYFGTDSLYQNSSNYNCSDWTSMASDQTGFGMPMHESFSFLDPALPMACHVQARLLCLQLGKGPESGRFDFTTRKVFTTSDTGNGNLSLRAGASGTGLAAGDSICKARALTAGLPNADRFIAWLSTSNTNAIDRLSSSGPWARLDGVVVAINKADLVDGMLNASISFNEFGIYNSTRSFTGTLADGTASANNCLDWTSYDSFDTGDVGRTAYTSSWTSDPSSDRCSDTNKSLICIED